MSRICPPYWGLSLGFRMSILEKIIFCVIEKLRSNFVREVLFQSAAMHCAKGFLEHHVLHVTNDITKIKPCAKNIQRQ